MTNDEMIIRVRKINGAYNWLVLHGIMDDADQVIDRHLNAEPLPFFGGATQSDDEIVSSAAAVLTGIVAKAFCEAISRSDALCILRALVDCKGLTVCDGVEFTEATLRAAWNDCHDDVIYAGEYQAMLEI